jgi:type II secretory pathway component PulF
MNLIHAFRRMNECGSLAPFYRRWAVAEASGLSLSTTLDSLAEGAPPPVEERVACLREALARGSLELDASSYGFTEVEVAFIQVGVESGSLEASLTALAGQFDADFRAVRRVRRKLSYPLFLMFCACWIPTLPMAFFGGLAIWIGTGLLGTAALFFFGGSGVIHYFRRLRSKPKEAQARFLNAMATALEAGIDYESSVSLAGQAAAPASLALQLKYLKPRGRPLAEVLQLAGGFESAVLSMVDTGEQAGQLPTSLRAAARYLEGGVI